MHHLRSLCGQGPSVSGTFEVVTRQRCSFFTPTFSLVSAQAAESTVGTEVAEATTSGRKEALFLLLLLSSAPCCGASSACCQEHQRRRFRFSKLGRLRQWAQLCIVFEVGVVLSRAPCPLRLDPHNTIL